MFPTPSSGQVAQLPTPPISTTSCRMVIILSLWRQACAHRLTHKRIRVRRPKSASNRFQPRLHIVRKKNTYSCKLAEEAAGEIHARCRYAHGNARKNFCRSERENWPQAGRSRTRTIRSAAPAGWSAWSRSPSARPEASRRYDARSGFGNWATGCPVLPYPVKGKSYLLVTRYDRKTDASGNVHRLHQEDFCQALGIAPERK